MMNTYEAHAAYRINVIEGGKQSHYTTWGAAVNTTISKLVEEIDEILSVEKIADSYKEYTLRIARGIA